MTNKAEIDQMISSMIKELECNEQLFAKVPADRLAKIASELFSTLVRVACILPADPKPIVGILANANNVVKAYNYDKPLQVGE